MSSGFSKTGLYWRTESALQPERPTILFIHASWMSSSMWEEVTQSLEPQLLGINLLLVDLNGHGKTINGRKEYTMWDQAEDTLSLLNELNLTKVLVVGLSMGSMIAARLALLPNTSTPASLNVKIAGLILAGSTATAASDADRQNFAQLRNIWVSTPTPSEEIMNGAILSWGGPTPDLNGPRASRIRQDWVSRHSGQENIDPTLKSLMERDRLLDRMGEIEVPVLLVHGEEDRTYPLQDAEDIRSRLVNAPEARLEVIKGEGHLLVYLREGGDVVQLIKGFSEKTL